MNQANKQKWAGVLGALVAIVTSFQGLLTAAPLQPEHLALVLTLMTFVVTSGTAFKQWLSPDVSNTGTQVTLVAAISVFILGLGELANLFNFAGHTAEWVKWGISALIMSINLVSKQIWPSQLQIERTEELKQTS